jgi:hypothetical protein
MTDRATIVGIVCLANNYFDFLLLRNPGTMFCDGTFVSYSGSGAYQALECGRVRGNVLY